MRCMRKPMNDILLIQPDASRGRLVKALQDAGVEVTQHSFIRLAVVETEQPDLHLMDAVIWVSKNAVEFARDRGVKLTSPLAMYAVGPATATLASQTFGLACQCPTNDHSSEGLLSFCELQHVYDQRWCIIKGKGGRELLSDTLMARGAAVTPFVVYERIKKPLKDPAIVQDWQQRITQIAVTSAEQLCYFLSELPDDAQHWLTQCHWIVPSERLAALIPFATKDKITITQSASETAMIKALIDNGSDYDRRQ